MGYGTMTMSGKRFVLVPEDEFKLLKRSPLPRLPRANPATGNFPAIQATRVGMARDIIKRREAVGLSQKGLAEAAGVRAETLNRIEKARVTADMATIVKLDKVLKRAESKNAKLDRI
jgi:ribosome-binding protein aMBF1 (putative translation factor)